jgi:NADH dehydrogenase
VVHHESLTVEKSPYGPVIQAAETPSVGMHVAVLGAGYAGLTLARRLEQSTDVELTVVDDTGDHVLVHELHRVVRRPSLAEDITIDLADALESASVREATVTGVDTDACIATLDGENGEQLEYDLGAVCLGSDTEFYDLSGVETHATPLKSLADAREIREGFFEVVEDGERVVVGGAGLSGIQVAGELAALAREEGVRDRVEVVLLEQEASVAPGFPEDFQQAAREELEARDVVVRTGATVQGATDAAVELADEELAYDQFVWTGGIRGPDALGGDRPTVRSTLRVGEDTFVLGDAGRVVDTDGEAVPASAQTAVREARVVARNIRMLAEYRHNGTGFEPRLDTYTFDSPGWLVSVGDGAVAQVGPTVLRGRPAKALKTSVGAGYLSSVGAIENAVDLVREELGMPDGDEETEP